MGVPPKSSRPAGFSIINPPFLDTPIYGNTHLVNIAKAHQIVARAVAGFVRYSH